jgi:hypothetical protein
MFIAVRMAGTLPGSLHNTLLPVSQIQRVVEPRNEGETGQIINIKGTEWIAEGDAIRELGNPVLHTMSAEKGTFVLFAEQENGAWLVYQDGDIKPAILGGIDSFDDD